MFVGLLVRYKLYCRRLLYDMVKIATGVVYSWGKINHELLLQDKS